MFQSHPHHQLELPNYLCLFSDLDFVPHDASSSLVMSGRVLKMSGNTPLHPLLSILISIHFAYDKLLGRPVNRSKTPEELLPPPDCGGFHRPGPESL